MTPSKADAVKAFEDSIAHLIEWGLMSRPLAIRWLAESNGVVSDRDELCRRLGLPDGYLAGEEVTYFVGDFS